MQEPFKVNVASIAALRIQPQFFASKLLTNATTGGLDAIKKDLDEGVGHVILRDFPIESRAISDISTDLNRLSEYLGSVTKHGVTGQSVWQVTPRTDLEHLPTFSETAAEAPLHTDNSWVPHPEKYTALLVVHPASEGGQSIVLSVEEALEGFSKRSYGKRAIEILSTHLFPFATPDVFLHEGERNRTQRRYSVSPVIESAECFRFRYDVIQEGFELAPELATEDAVWAVKVFHEFLTEQMNRLERIALKTGELLIVNNHRVMHARTHFNDPTRFLLRTRMS